MKQQTHGKIHQKSRQCRNEGQTLLRVNLYIQLFFTKKNSGNKINVDIKMQKHTMKIEKYNFTSNNDKIMKKAYRIIFAIIENKSL